MSDIRIGLTIKDDPSTQGGLIKSLMIAAELPAMVGAPIEVSIQAAGFNPDEEGALSIASMLMDISSALLREIRGLPGDPAVKGPASLAGRKDPGHDIRDFGGPMREETLHHGPESLRRPPFNPQPVVDKPKQ